jgi:flagellar motor switch protein FliG
VAIVQRMSKLGQINPEVLRRAEGSLREKVRAQGEIVTQEVDGQAVLAEILRNMPSAGGQQILDELRLQDRALAQSLAKRLMTLDVVFAIPDRDLQALLRDFSDSELALLAKGLSELQQARLAANLSERRWQLIEQESEALGSVLRSEVDRALQEFLDYIRQQREKGEIQIIHDGDKTVE